MCSQEEAKDIVREMSARIASLFPDDQLEALLFGSYARGDQQEGSDIDIMYLVDTSTDEISRRGWDISAAAADLLLEHGIVVSPIVENRAYFRECSDYLPFFKNVLREGIAVDG